MNKSLTTLLLITILFSCQFQSDVKEKEEKIFISIPLCTSFGSIDPIKTLPAPIFREGIGNSHLSISSKNKEAQKWFNQGINLLHGFWHIEAYRVFKEVIKADSSCAMGYWGIAMCQPGFSSAADNSEWVSAIDKALSLSEDVSSIEKALIQSTAVLIKKGIGQAETEYRKLYQNFPKEPEAIAFASIILRQYPNPKIQEEIKNLLEKALIQFPDKTALQHYYIHIMELDAKFSKAIPLAEKMIETAPNSPHLMHMPGHLYYLKGDYEQAVAVFSKAKTQEEIYHRTEHIPFIANQNYMHNIQFLTVALAEQGKYNLALKTAEQLTNIQLNTKAEDINTLFLVYEGRLLPILVHFRFREWEAGIKKLKTLLNFAWVETKYPPVFSYLNCLKFYAQGMLAVEQGNKHTAIESVKKLTKHLREFEQKGMQTQGTISFRVVNETHDIINMSRYELAGWIDNMDTKQPFKPMAWENAISLEQVIRYDEPPRLLYPISESLGRLHTKRGEIKQAKKAFQQALKKRPNSPIIKELIEKLEI